MSRRHRGLVFTLAIARTAAAVVVLVTIYFVVPMDQVQGPLAVLYLVIGLIVLAAVLIAQIRATVRAQHPALRAVQSLGVSVPLLLLLFSSAHFLLGATAPGSYTQALTRLDALYFSVTMFTTVGFGDIAAVSQTARVITTLQMLVNLVFLGVVARVLFGAALDGRHDTDEESLS